MFYYKIPINFVQRVGCDSVRGYIARRTARFVVTLWALATVTFALLRLPENGALARTEQRLLRHPNMDQTERTTRIEQSFNVAPDDPIVAQYVDYLGGLLTGNMGVSINQREPVLDIVVETLPWTVFLLEGSVLVIFILALVVGIPLAYYEGTKLDSAARVFSFVTPALPIYVYGPVGIYLFANIAGIVPARYNYNGEVATPGLSVEFVGSVLGHAVLPIAVMAISSTGLLILATRDTASEIRRSDFVHVARLRGLSERRIATRYVTRSVCARGRTGVVLVLSLVLAEAVVLEYVFSYGGLGWELLGAFRNRDFPLILGLFLTVTVTTAVAVYIADLVYLLLDPRIADD